MERKNDDDGDEGKTGHRSSHHLCMSIRNNDLNKNGMYKILILNRRALFNKVLFYIISLYSRIFLMKKDC